MEVDRELQNIAFRRKQKIIEEADSSEHRSSHDAINGGAGGEGEHGATSYYHYVGHFISHPTAWREVSSLSFLPTPTHQL